MESNNINFPKISIVIPVYNVEAYLLACLESCIAQTYSNVEIVVVNDGSTDGCYDLIEQFKIRNNIIAVHKFNEGVTSARKIGVKKATGQYLCFLDSDDCLTSDSIEILYRQISLNNLDVVIGNFFIDSEGIRKKNNQVNEGVLTPESYVKDLLYGKLHGGPVCRLFKIELFKELDLIFDISREIVMCEDLLMNIKIAKYANRIGIYNMYVYIYNIRSLSVNHTFQSSCSYEKSFLKTLQRTLKDYGFENQLEEAFVHRKCMHVIKLLSFGVRIPKNDLFFKKILDSNLPFQSNLFTLKNKILWFFNKQNWVLFLLHKMNNK